MIPAKPSVEAPASPVDMSPDAIARRLRMVGELHELAMSLSRAEFLRPVGTAAEESWSGWKNAATLRKDPARREGL